MACGDVLRLTGPLPWDDDKYLHPFIEDDPLLQYGMLLGQTHLKQ